MNKIVHLAVLIAFVSSCTSLRVKKAFRASDLPKQASGILIRELATGKVIFSHRENEFFMPASNMKLATMLVAKRNLRDAIPSFKYVETQDSLFFWGTGDPSLLHPKLKGDALLKKLQTSAKVLVYADEERLVKSMGDGWAWDDYNDDYAAEISQLPLYNNQVRIQKKEGVWQIFPAYFKQNMHVGKQKDALRARLTNQIELPDTTVYPAQAIPFITSVELSSALLADTLHKPVLVRPMAIPSNAKTHYAGHLDSLLIPMMHTSDNQIAEQLLYVIAAERSWLGPTAKILGQIKKEEPFFASLRWVDGSGLSRYNLVRPSDMIQMLGYLANEVPMEKLQIYLPEIGKSGTLRNSRLSQGGAAWAKSGSFGNTYDLSGYYRDSKGKMYLFSILTNLANRSIAASKSDVISILNALR
jgi:D-alanyl-D-alanine carboxypeptidase/D-alanyl-D-alanine-endopeptidase (penicillin-binding protein 4)